MKKWTVASAMGGDEIIAEFGEFFGGLLARRGINTMDKAREFFACDKLSDPFELKDMDKAVEIIKSALDAGDKITIYGDYDCDGVTATVMLHSYLEAMGAEVEYYIPDRSEGYGMNIPAVTKILDCGSKLIITVDTGITALEEAALIKERGAKLVITDHHQPPEQLPDCEACVDPHRADDISAFKDLCGAGVALKLLCALEGDENFITEQYADLAAVGTIGDVMPIRGENRYIVRRGLDSIHTGQNPGLEQLIRASGASPKNITSTQIVYSVAPRINSAGRMSIGGETAGADKAARLLMSDNVQNAASLAEELCLLNTERKTTESEILESVYEELSSNPRLLNERVIIAAKEGLQGGIIGIIASKLTEKYGKPSMVITIEGDTAHGSMRSVEGFSAHKLLTACSEPLTRFGGHAMAGGFTLPADRLEEFKELVYRNARENCPKMPAPCIHADMEVTGAALNVENVKLLQRLEPFGEGNPPPLFLLKNCTLISKRSVKDGKYTSFEISSGGETLKAISFKTPYEKFFPKVGDSIDILTNAEIREYNGRTTVSLKVVDMRPSDFNEDRFFAAKRVYEEIKRGEGCDPRLAPRVIPQDRSTLVAIFTLVRDHGEHMSAEEMCIYGLRVNYCMLRITLDAFAEVGIVKLSPDAEKVELIPTNGQKFDLFSNGLLADLNRELFQRQ